jgi:hypothetical protein
MYASLGSMSKMVEEYLDEITTSPWPVDTHVVHTIAISALNIEKKKKKA